VIARELQTRDTAEVTSIVARERHVVGKGGRRNPEVAGSYQKTDAPKVSVALAILPGHLIMKRQDPKWSDEPPPAIPVGERGAGGELSRKSDVKPRIFTSFQKGLGWALGVSREFPSRYDEIPLSPENFDKIEEEAAGVLGLLT
jgi:hypothetical protein